MKQEIIKKMADSLRSLELDRDIHIMEVCGTHTTEFFRTGVRDIFPSGLHLIDGPGCPVCVTPNTYLDRAIQTAIEHDVILASFGDMIRVPSSYSSLAMEKTRGMDIRTVYSPMGALDIAEENRHRQVVFLSVGFETTAPAEAAAVIEARDRGIDNFSILPGNKLTIPAVRALLDAEEVNIDGFILPGHVSAVTGVRPWHFIPDEYGLPCVVAGFGPHELIIGTLSLISMIREGVNDVKNEYKTAVKDMGNTTAIDLMYSVFEPEDTVWRGIGMIPESGLKLRSRFTQFDASKKFSVTLPEPREHAGCRCGELLRGLITPPECPLFGKGCRPESPVGPCMVSTEGPCAAYYRYRRNQ